MKKTPKLTPHTMRIHANPGDQARSSADIFPIIFNEFRLIAKLREEATGAQKRTRTSTPLRAPPPEDGASTNSAIWALVAKPVIEARLRVGARH